MWSVARFPSADGYYIVMEKDATMPAPGVYTGYTAGPRHLAAPAPPASTICPVSDSTRRRTHALPLICATAAGKAFLRLPEPRQLDIFPRLAGIYVHVPFCSTKCHYCDFYSVADQLHQSGTYLDALDREFDLQTGHFGVPEPETIFIGGGTPTLLTPSHLARLLEIVRRHLKTTRLVEFTVEANPNTFDAQRATVLKQAGVNRISFGAQSFIPEELVALQREHSPEDVPRAVDFARAAGITRINLDLIFGIPGQNLASLETSLRRAVALNPEHLSCYNLTYEPNTPLAARRARGDIAPLDEALELAMFRHVQTMLTQHGFTRYEISNYARAGAECQHNLHYWRGAFYLGFGPSAAGHHSGWRWKNSASLNRYTQALIRAAPCLPIASRERLTGWARWGELAMLRLRLSAGLQYGPFQRQTGVDTRALLAGVRRKYEGLGLLNATPDALALTDAAVPVSDTILADVLAAFGAKDGSLCPAGTLQGGPSTCGT